MLHRDGVGRTVHTMVHHLARPQTLSSLLVSSADILCVVGTYRPWSRCTVRPILTADTVLDGRTGAPRQPLASGPGRYAAAEHVEGYGTRRPVRVYYWSEGFTGRAVTGTTLWHMTRGVWRDLVRVPIRVPVTVL